MIQWKNGILSVCVCVLLMDNDDGLVMAMAKGQFFWQRTKGMRQIKTACTMANMTGRRESDKSKSFPFGILGFSNVTMKSILDLANLFNFLFVHWILHFTCACFARPNKGKQCSLLRYPKRDRPIVLLCRPFFSSLGLHCCPLAKTCQISFLTVYYFGIRTI